MSHRAPCPPEYGPSYVNPIRRRASRRFKSIAAGAVTGALVAIAGMTLVPPAHGPVGPSTMSLGARAGPARTRVAIPPLGTISASTHAVPVTLRLGLVEVDAEELARALAEEGDTAVLRAQMEEDLRRLAVAAAARTTAVVVVASAALAALVLGRRLATVASAAGAALVTVVIAGTTMFVTYDVAEFQEPTFSGSLTKAREVVDAVTQGQEALDEARSRFRVATERLTNLLALLSRPNLDPTAGATVVLHVSDVHANPLGFEVVAELARRFDVDAVIDTGDLASSVLDTGGISSVIDPVDKMIARSIERVDRPYVYVPGNHDSPRLRERVARIPTVTLLHRKTATIGTVSFLGWADPSFSYASLSHEEQVEIRAAAAVDVAAAVDRERPDVLLVHDPRLGAESYGRVPLILAGHIHERAETSEDGTLELVVGTTGATGIKAFTVEADRRYEAQVLYFQGDTLLAVDYVALEELGGDFELSRKTYGYPLE